MRKISIIFLLVFFCLSTSAQSPVLKELKLIFNGKSMPLTCVIMDKEGVLWLGNQLGVFSYNGYQIKQIYNANRLSKEVITLFEDSNGYVWAGTRGGNILRFYNYQELTFNPAKVMPKSAITSITQDMEGNVWFATMGDGIFVYHRNTMIAFNSKDGLSHNNVYCLLPDRKGSVLCGTDKGINYMNIKDGKKHISKKMDTGSGMFSDTVTTLAYFENNILIIGSKGRGAYFYYENRNKFEMFCKHSLPVTDICVLGNEIWIGTEDNGIIDCEFYPYAINRNLNLAFEYGITHIQKLLKTPYYFQFILAENKLYVTQGEWFQKIPLPDENPNPKPKAITVGFGHIYALYSHGIFKRAIDGNSLWIPVYLGQKINFDAVSSMVIDQYENLWIGSRKEGVYCVDKRNVIVRHLDQSKGLKDNAIFRLRLVNNTIYYGSRTGIGFIKIVNDRLPVRFENQINKMPVMQVNDIAVSLDSNTLWLGTEGNGIIRITETGSKIFLASLPNDKRVIYSMARDKEDKVWYTTMNYGLYKLLEDNTESVNYLKNTNYSAINSLFIDNKDNVVTIHDDFILIYNPVSKQQYSQIGDFGFTLINYTRNMLATQDGKYYMMSKEGIYVYQPERFSFMSNLPAFIHNINVNLQNIKHRGDEELTLSYNENHLNFQLYTPWYGNHDKIKYMYVLEGLNTDTVYTSDNNLYFPNLPSGSYTLKVRPVIIGSVIDTKWSEKKFVISKPWYKTIWFIIAFALSGFVILYFINYNFLKNQNRSNEIERQRLRQEIKILNNQINPHFLFNSLNNLISIIDIDTVNAKIYTAHLADFYRLIVAYKDNYVIALEEDLKISRIFVALQNIRFSDAIVYRVKVPEAYYKCYVPPLTLQILVENAIKHNKVSQALPLHIDISVEKDFLIVRNNISPKENLESSTKSGIKFIVDRFDFVTKSKPIIIQTDTEFIVKIPLIFNEPLPV